MREIPEDPSCAIRTTGLMHEPKGTSRSAARFRRMWPHFLRSGTLNSPHAKVTPLR